MKFRILAGMLFLGVVAGVLFLVSPWVVLHESPSGDKETGPMQADFYVAPGGNDRSPGTKDAPFATLTRARDAIRELKKAGPNRDLRVLLRGGTYRLRETVVFSLQDSAVDGHTITYAAYPGETPVLTSGVPVGQWRKLDDAPEGLPAEAHGKVWSAPCPEGISRFYTLYDGQRRLARARGRGFRPTDKSSSWRAEDQNTLRFPEGAVRNGSNVRDWELVLVPAAPWTMNILPLESVDEEARVLSTVIRGTYALTQPRFGYFPESAWIENALSGLDQPGEWVLNTRQRRIYLWPEGDAPGDNIVAPCLTELVRVEGDIDYDGPRDVPVRGLVFRGLTFTQADRYTWEKDHEGWGLQHDWEMFDRPTAMLRMRGAENCAIEQCRFVNSGASAIRLDLHCWKNKIDHNVIEHVGGVGILLAGYGPGTKDVNGQNEVTRNHIHHIGELYWHSPGIFVWQSGENLIGNNLIHHTPYSGIVVSGRIHWNRSGNGECSRTIRWKEVDGVLGSDQVGRPDWKTREPFLHGRGNLILRNDIHHTVEILTDGNGIYISGTGGGNVIRENFVHDCPSRQFGEGIRCDDDQNETLIDRNIIWRLGGLATFIAIKGRNDITGNILACPLNPPRRGMLSLEPTSQGGTDGSIIQRNIFYSDRAGDTISHQNPHGPLARCNSDHNLYFNTADPDWGKRHLAVAQELGSESGSVSANPLFVNAAEGDFRFEVGSPARALGFAPINRDLIGLHADTDNAPSPPCPTDGARRD